MEEIERLQIELRGAAAKRFAKLFAEAIERQAEPKWSKAAFGRWLLMQGMDAAEKPG